MDWLAVVRTHRAKKRLGQSFLVHEPTLKKLVDEWGIEPVDEVFEIGTGPGNLTSALAKAARRVWSAEIDPAVAALARKHVEAANIIWMEGDARMFMERLQFGQPMRVVGNLPYSAYYDILLAILEWDSPVVDICVMLQEDVVRKMTRPGPMNCLFEVAKLSRIPRNRFYPQPRVDSGALRLKPRLRRGARRVEQGLKRIFSARKKTLKAFGGPSIRAGEAEPELLLDLADRLTQSSKGA